MVPRVLLQRSAPVQAINDVGDVGIEGRPV